jgi:hypothetical protein
MTVDADDDERPEWVGLDGGQGGDQVDGGDGNTEPARKLVAGEDSETRGHPAAPRGSLPLRCNRRRLERVMPFGSVKMNTSGPEPPGDGRARCSAS